MNVKKDFISTLEAAKILSVSRITVFNKIKAGKIPAMKIGRNFAIKKRDVLKAAGELLTSRQKRGINNAVERAAKQYGEVFRRLGKE